MEKHLEGLEYSSTGKLKIYALSLRISNCEVDGKWNYTINHAEVGLKIHLNLEVVETLNIKFIR
ncbi:MAG: hypothetical protein QW201_01490 [Thermoproteota archaeon]